MQSNTTLDEPNLSQCRCSNFPQKEIISWKSKVQYRKATPYLSLIKSLGKKHVLARGNEIECKLVMSEGKLQIVIELE